jgi:DNA-binding transcriptional MerR regulator
VTESVEERAHLSIGEVLSLLREEFADITISKIRFLESQGLVDPERTPSGYRKFYEDDVERLRWILRQQREHFLPLKVIKGRLTEAGSENDIEGAEESVAEDAANGGLRAEAAPEPPEQSQESFTLASSMPTLAAAPEPAAPSAPVAASDPADVPPPRPAPAGSRPSAAALEATMPAKGAGSARTPARPPARPAPAPEPSVSGPGSSQPAEEPVTTVNMTAQELANATGLSAAAVRELERFGLVTGRDLGGTAYFDAEALAVAEMAAGFARYGVEARHLRMYKNAAERETGLFEQVVMPLFKQRNPQARQQAMGTLEELSRLGAELRGALLRAALRDAF